MKGPFDAVILLAHGARDARWLEPFVRMRADLGARLGPATVALSFLDFAPPTFADAAEEIVRRGAQRVLVVPVFLSGGGHVAKDVPALVAPVRERYPNVSFSVSGALGEEPEVVSAMGAAVVRLRDGQKG